MSAAPLIVASNRGPVTFERDGSGELEAKRGAGGLVTALTGSLQEAGGLWVAAAISDADRELASESATPPAEDGAAYRLRFVEIPPERYDRYYTHISNEILWFAHHHLWDTVHSPTFGEETRRSWDDYVEVNHTFARTLAEEGDRASG